MTILVSEVVAAARRLVSDRSTTPGRMRSTDDDYYDWVTQAMRSIAALRPDLFATQDVMPALRLPGPSDPDPDPTARGFQEGSNYHTGPADSFRIIEVIRYQPNVNLDQHGRRTTTGGKELKDWFPVDEISYRPLANQSSTATFAAAIATAGGSTAFSVATSSNPLMPRRRGKDDLYTRDTRPQWARHPQSPNSFYFFPKPGPMAKLHLEYAKSPGKVMAMTDPLTIADVYFPAVVAATASLAEMINDESVLDERAENLDVKWRRIMQQEAQSREIVDTEAAAVAGVIHGRRGGAQTGGEA